jgi:cobalamin biosynthetic protein CobC
VFPNVPEPWVDLSTGVNPRPYPAAFASPAARARLPDLDEIATLEANAAAAFGLEPACVLATAGAEQAIRLMASTVGGGRAALVEPTYSGHRAALEAVGVAVTTISRTDLDLAIRTFDVVVLVNPNNPDGGAVLPDRLAELGGKAGPRGGWLIVDEAFVDVRPDLSVAKVAGRRWSLDRVVTLRSFGKFYGLPGVRLGFVTAHPSVIERLREKLGAWPVSADAIAAGTEAYADTAWNARTREYLAEESERLNDLLVEAGFEIVGGTALFRLASVEDAAARFLKLAEVGVLSRPFVDAPRWLRFGLPADEQWPRVRAALMESRP